MDKLDFAIQVLVLGFMVVVVTLFALYGILLFFNRIFYKGTDQTAVASSSDGKGYAETGDEDIMRRTTAVILAALYHYMQDDPSINRTGRINITVRASGSIGENNWRISGRKNILENRIELENIRRKKQIEKI